MGKEKSKKVMRKYFWSISLGEDKYVLLRKSRSGHKYDPPCDSWEVVFVRPMFPGAKPEDIQEFSPTKLHTTVMSVGNYRGIQSVFTYITLSEEAINALIILKLHFDKKKTGNKREKAG